MGHVNGKPMLSEEDFHFIVNHTALSHEEVNRQYEHFLFMHPDGKVSKKIFRNMMNTSFPDMNTAKFEIHTFRMYDANHDGYIDFKEFMMVFYAMANGNIEESLKQIFRIFDMNSNGTLTQNEIGMCFVCSFHKWILSKS